MNFISIINSSKILIIICRGPVGVVLFNHSEDDFIINAGDRIAQLILEQIITPDVVEVEELSSTERGAGGFGSTGVSTTSAEDQENKKQKVEK